MLLSPIEHKPSRKEAGPSAGLRRFSKVVASATLALLFAGGMVTSTGSGLAVPDWPNTYGRFMFAFPFSQMVGGIFYEHLHRMIASVVGILTVILALWLWKREPRRWVRMLGWTALGAVILQGILGGVTVLLMLPPAISILHGVLAQSFFCLSIVIAVALSRDWSATKLASPSNDGEGRLFLWAGAASVALYAQLILGAVMRHTGSGLAFLDFPLADGAVLPSFDAAMLSRINAGRFELGLDSVTVRQTLFHFAHRVGAAIVLTAMTGLVFQSWRLRRTGRWAFRMAGGMGLLVTAQVALAAFVIWTGRNPWVATAHQWMGAVILGGAVLLTAKVARRTGIGPILALQRRAQDLATLTKVGIATMVLVSASLGFLLADRASGSSIPFRWGTLLHLLIGTMLAAAGAGALNEFLEREHDGRMERTKSRPVVAGRISIFMALLVGGGCSVAGVVYLYAMVNPLAAGLALATVLLYAALYTPMKRVTVWNTLIGSVPGAAPILGGWAAAMGTLDQEAWLLFTVVFLWQIPHFLSLAWIFREDYRRAGFRMITTGDDDGKATVRWIVISSVALVVSSLALYATGMAGRLFLLGASAIGTLMIYASVDMAIDRNTRRARLLFRASLLYLPLLAAILLLDRGMA